MRYYAVYICPLCGKRLRLPNSAEIPYDKLPEMLGNVIQNQQFAGNAYLHKAPMQIPCKCGDGNAGLAQFAGFVQEH